MNDNVEHIMLDHLRALLRGGQERIEQKLSEITARLTSLETAVVKSRGDNLGTQEDVYRQQSMLDRLAERVERIERQLEIRAE